MLLQFILLICMLLIIVFWHTTKYQKENFNNLFLIKVYIIHQKDKIHRMKQIQNQLKYFSNYTFVEPVSTKYIENNMESLIENGFIIPKVKTDIYHEPIQGELTLPSLSLALTMYNIYQLQQDKDEMFLILEDDFLLSDNFIQKFIDIMKDVPQNWDILYLSCHVKSFLQRNPSQKYNSVIKVSKLIHGMGAVLYNKNVASFLVKNILPFVKQIDHDLPKKFFKEKQLLNGYILRDENLKKIIENNNYYYHSTTQNVEK